MSRWAVRLLSVLGSALVRYGILLLVRANRRTMEDAATAKRLTRRWKIYVAQNIQKQLERNRKQL